MVKPVLQALLLADHVYVDEATKKRVIAGTFNRLVVIPKGLAPTKVSDRGEQRQVLLGGLQAGSPTVYISLTEITKKSEFVLRLVNLEHDKVLIQIEFTISSDDPLATVEVAVPMPSLPQIPGTYALELLTENEPLGSHRLTIVEANLKG